MKKIFDKLDKLEKKIESKEKASKKILVFIAEKLNNGAYECVVNFRKGTQQRFILKDSAELDNYIAQNELGVVLIDDLIDFDDNGNKRNL